ncbi:MAG: dipeptide/oligopeptide/nickel ABC transporter permease/ATP-binding protein [Termitinemataceae bacterium]|nr:MAG: dipeptide/oligopeptide/nickel ABC transporter permease/ATP-binding protein [Termitinemataceae bacterium]
MKRIYHKLLHEKLFIFGIIIAIIFLAIVILSPLISPHDPYKTDITKSLRSPSFEYPLGNDEQGRCILSRLIYGTRTTITAALSIEIFILVIGSIAGIAAGYFGGIIDVIVLTLIDVLLSFPSFILALVIAGILGFGISALMIAMIAVYWVEPARIARSLCRTLREKDFILGERALGASDLRIIFYHIAPNLVPSMLVYGALNMSSVIISVSSMSFLGLGVRPPIPEWGNMLTTGRFENPLMIIAVIVCIIAVSAAFQMIGESARDVLNPRFTHLDSNSKKQIVTKQITQTEGSFVTERSFINETQSSALLKVSNLTISFPLAGNVVHDFNFEINQGQAVGLVGDSGCGKTVFCSALLGMVEKPGFIKSGSIIYSKDVGQVRGKDIAMLSQNYAGSLNAGRTIGAQFVEVIRAHKKNITKYECIETATAMLENVALDNPKQILHQYPFELSGGMLQRVTIAMALVHNPKLLIADEPTSALDTINQSAILNLFIQRRKNYNTAIIFVSHDIEAAEMVCDRIVKIYNPAPAP